MIYSFFAGVLLLEPLKVLLFNLLYLAFTTLSHKLFLFQKNFLQVLLISALVACICKNFDLDDDDVDDDEKKAECAERSQW